MKPVDRWRQPTPTGYRCSSLCATCGGGLPTDHKARVAALKVQRAARGRAVRKELAAAEPRNHPKVIALRKRDVDKDEVARAINDIVRKLEGNADGDVPSQTVGELVMQALAGLDQVAYIRYASVYRNFDEATDFEAFVEKELGD